MNLLRHTFAYWIGGGGLMLWMTTSVSDVSTPWSTYQCQCVTFTICYGNNMLPRGIFSVKLHIHGDCGTRVPLRENCPMDLATYSTQRVSVISDCFDIIQAILVRSRLLFAMLVLGGLEGLLAILMLHGFSGITLFDAKSFGERRLAAELNAERDRRLGEIPTEDWCCSTLQQP